MTWQEEEAREEAAWEADRQFRLLYGCSQEEAARREARSLLLRLAIMGRLQFEQWHGRMTADWLLRLRQEAGYPAEPDCDIQRRILGLA